MEYKFKYHWGGEDNWYTKSKRWANKQKFPFNHLALGIIEWLWVMWVQGKVDMEMTSVDKQVNEIMEQWEENEKSKPDIVEEGVFGEEGWSIGISNPTIERRSEEPDTGMGPERNEV